MQNDKQNSNNPNLTLTKYFLVEFGTTNTRSEEFNFWKTASGDKAGEPCWGFFDLD